MLREWCLIYGEQNVALAFIVLVALVLIITIKLGKRPKIEPISEQNSEPDFDTVGFHMQQIARSPIMAVCSKYTYLRGFFMSGIETVYIMCNTVTDYVDTLTYLNLPPIYANTGRVQYRMLSPSVPNSVDTLIKHGGLIVMGYGAALAAPHYENLLTHIMGNTGNDMPFAHRIRFLMAGKEADKPRKPRSKRS